MAASIAKIYKYTKSITVDGNNAIQVEITWEDKSSGKYENELVIKFGNKQKVIQLNTKNGFLMGHTMVIPVSWLSEIPDTDKGTGHIFINTYDMNSSSNTPSTSAIKKFTVYVPEDFKPDISDLSMDILDTKSYPVDYAVYGITFPRFTAKVTPHSTSPISKCRITGGGYDVWAGFTYDKNGSGDYNFMVKGPAITTWTKTKFKVTVYDARGRKDEITSDEIYVQSYNRPSINSLSAYRTDSNGIPQEDGDHIKVILDASISPIKDSSETNINTMDCFLSWNAVNGYGDNETIRNKEAFIFEADKELGYEIECLVRDKYMETRAYCSVLGDNKDFNIVEGGGGAAIGMKAEEGYFDVAHESRFFKEVSATKEISSDVGFVSYGTGSKGDFLSFGEARRIATWYHTNSSGTVVDEWGDFDEIDAIGLHGVYYDADVSASNYYRVMNAPCEKAGTLRVFNATGNMDDDATEMYLMQEYVVRDGSAVYRRCLSKKRADEDTEWPTSWSVGSWYRYSGTKI